MDNTILGGLSQTQLNWIDKVLATPARKKIVYGHLPLFPFAKGRHREVLDEVRLEHILDNHNVDIFISGHHHVYYPGTTESMKMLSVPCLGNGARILRGTESRSSKGIVKIKIQGNELNLEGYNAADDFSLIPKSTLPTYLDFETIRIWRDDLPVHEREHLLIMD